MQLRMGLLILGCSWFGLIILPGCTLSSSNHRAPVVSLKGKPRILRGHTIVCKGDTLFTIAKRSGHEPQTLAIINNIPPPYTLKLGQKILFNQPQPVSQAVQISGLKPGARSPIEARERTQEVQSQGRQAQAPSLITYPSNSTLKVDSQPSPKPTFIPSTIEPAEMQAKMVAAPMIKPIAPPVDSKASTNALNSSSAAIQGSVQWRWPVQGTIIRTFQATEKGQGIDIANASGTAIKAAASGVVVYSGNGLKGYGNLIIIKHTEDFLSAYAHNRELKVKEGERISLGQEIATMGRSGADCVKLHFEIRYRGKPVDPIKFLPKG